MVKLGVIVDIKGCQKSRAFHIRIKKNGVSHIVFVEKKGLIIYLAALKKGAIRHAHPYHAIYRKLPPPPPSPPSRGFQIYYCIVFCNIICNHTNVTADKGNTWKTNFAPKHILWIVCEPFGQNCKAVQAELVFTAAV